MKIRILVILFSTQVLYAQNWQWANKLDVLSYNHLMCADSYGNCYLALNFNDSAYIIKADSNGHENWRQAIHGKIQVHGLAANGNAIYISGSMYGKISCANEKLISMGDWDGFLLSLNQNGIPRWMQRSGGEAMDEARGICIDNGYVYQTGYFSDTSYFGNLMQYSPCGKMLFISKYDSLGNLVYNTSASCLPGPTGSADGYSIKIDKDKNILCSGTYEYFQLDTLKLYGGGDYNRWFLAKIDPSGKPLWLQEIMHYTVAHFEGMEVDSVGDIYLNGYESWTLGGGTLMQKVSANGQVLWTSGIGSMCSYGQSYSFSICMNEQSPFTAGYLAEGYNCSKHGGLMLVRYDPSGAVASFDTIHTRYVYNTRLVKSVNGCYFLSGLMYDTLALGAHTLFYNQKTELFIARFDEFSLSLTVAALSKQSQVSLYPNPSHGIIQIQGPRPEIFRVLNVLGENIYETKPGNQIDVSFVKNGIYTVELVYSTEKVCRRLIIANP